MPPRPFAISPVRPLPRHRSWRPEPPEPNGLINRELAERLPGRREPRVKESQIREDFSAAFEFEWLKKMRSDNRSGIEKSAPAWTVPMKRKAPAKPALAPNDRSLGLGGL